ncbi:MAG: hypothetical protein FDZ70_03990 [Actinobacteria bacterium]|nr:MAG: hypothetical protein FDZ70_03990 [Actinomycetota bacterium]
MGVGRHSGLDWDFLDRMGAWTVRLAAIAALAGAIVTLDVRFAVSCMLGAAIDVLLLHWVAERGKSAIAEDRLGGGLIAAFLAERILVKAVLLVGATALPALSSFWGMVTGVVAFDVTLITVGPVVSARSAFRGGA